MIYEGKSPAELVALLQQRDQENDVWRQRYLEEQRARLAAEARQEEAADPPALPPSAVVTWEDNHCSEHPLSREEASKLKPMRRIAQGWVLADNAVGITLAMDISAEQPDEGDPVLFIDRRTIVSVQVRESAR